MPQAWSVLSIALATTAAAYQPVRPPAESSSSSSRSCLGWTDHCGKTGALQMGGYYSEAEESDDLSKADRSKTHMIFGVRSTETEHQFSIPNGSDKTTVVGLQPLSDLEEEEDEAGTSDGTICKDHCEGGRILSALLDHLWSEGQNGNDDDVLELVEVGADPLVSLAATRVLGGSRRTVGVVARHPDERRLRVLEHAHSFFNTKTTTGNGTFRTEHLGENSPLSTTSTHTDGSSFSRVVVVVFTSAALVSSRLDEAVAGIAAADRPNYRVLVPSAIVSPEQLERYEYRSIQEGTDGSKKPGLLEILSSE